MSEKNKRLETAQSIWKYAVNHESYIQWYSSAVENFRFRSGINFGQWIPIDIDTVARRGQQPLTVNIVNSLINNLAGVEIQSKHRVACRIDHEDTEELNYSELSKALTHFLLFFQEHEEIPFHSSLKFQDAMTCGLGWSAIFKENDIIQYKYINPLDIIPDFDDMSPQFDHSKYICKQWYIARDKILSMYPKAKKEINWDDLSVFDQYSVSEALQRQSKNFSYEPDYNSTHPLVCEVQYKVAKKAFTGLTKNGRYFETFDLDKAEEIADSKSNIDEIDAEQIMRTLFIGDCLLESAPLDPSFPNQTDFSFVPLVWQKDNISNVPYGFLEPLKSIQIDLNKRVTDSIYFMNSNQYIVEGSLPDGFDKRKMKDELRNRNSIIFSPVGGKITVHSSIPLGEEQIKIVNQYIALLKQVSGVQDEMLGIQTNATSGIAQKIRQVNSVRTNIFAFDILAYMKKREARVALNLFQNSFVENFYIDIFENEEKQTLYLNMVVEDMAGNMRIENDVSFLPVSLYFEEIPDIRSSLEEKRENAIMIAQNPSLLSMPSLLRDMGMRHADKYIEEFQKNQQMAMMQQQPQGEKMMANQPAQPS